MNTSIPHMRKHKNGQWFTKWGGQFRYFGRDRPSAQEKYLRSLAEWQAWKSGKPKPVARGKILVAELLRLFMEYKAVDPGPQILHWYSKHLKRFCDLYANTPAENIKAEALQHVKSTMKGAGYADVTINHDITAVRSMFKWAEEMEIIKPVRLSAVKKIVLAPPDPKAYTVPQIAEMLKMATDGGKEKEPRPELVPWLKLQYLGFMRPSEVIRLVRREGEFQEPWLFRMKSKVQRRTGEFRHVVLSPQALSELALAEPIWARLDSYSQAVRDACPGFAPGRLRHSAATHLLQLGEDRETVDLLLGHLPSRVSRTYAPIAWSALRPSAARISL